ncbi:hypothetical protein F8M41_012840 [Gigaspora margarita]|uniref:FAR1 domain-containing protein n=1 Tax=Gigaspora margarita TaxID=4874 RepID=A0A8H3WYE7_GIGMA|nr:hypothetical protein F8M41_012840 [Gigaspora margarita]
MEDITNTKSNALNRIVDLFNLPISEDIDKCDFKEESTKSKKRESSAKNTNCTNISLIMDGQYYDTTKDILDAAQENAINLGFAVAIKSSSSRHLYIHCKRSGQPRNNWDLTVDTQQKKRMSKRCKCSYLLKAVPDNSKCHISEIKDKHNHSMAKDFQVFHEHRQLT